MLGYPKFGKTVRKNFLEKMKHPKTILYKYISQVLSCVAYKAEKRKKKHLPNAFSTIF